MLFRKKEEDIEMGGIGEQKRKNEGPQDTEYQSLDWKKIFLSPKYIRTSSRPWRIGTSRLITNKAWHILGILILIATALLTIFHDQAVEVSTIPCPRHAG
jgi:hypothetical protein